MENIKLNRKSSTSIAVVVVKAYLTIAYRHRQGVTNSFRVNLQAPSSRRALPLAIKPNIVLLHWKLGRYSIGTILLLRVIFLLCPESPTAIIVAQQPKRTNSLARVAPLPLYDVQPPNPNLVRAKEGKA